MFGQKSIRKKYFKNNYLYIFKLFNFYIKEPNKYIKLIHLLQFFISF